MFITNSDTNGANLGQRLGELMNISNQLDMLVGFFYFSGVSVLANSLESNSAMRMRVLVGMEAEQYLGQLVEVFHESGANDDASIRQRFYASMQNILGSVKVDNRAFHERIRIFIKLLEENRIEIRKTREPNHAKLYIFTMDEAHRSLREKLWITGSSNFSEPGLALRNEFNVEICDFGADEASRYFEELWDDSVPLTDDEDQRMILLRILKDSSVAAAVTPFEAYFLIMQNYLEHQQVKLNSARLDRILKDAKFEKYRYQVDAVAQAIAKLDAYHGVIIADVVGLGKSIIAGLIAAMRQKRGLIICPPGLIGKETGDMGGWYEYKHRFRLTNWEIWSRGKMEDLLEKLRHDPDFDMVIVDEAHNFRNEKTYDYGALALACKGKDVVLLTATPFNNRPGDLLALLHLFSNGKNSPFVPGGDLDDRFKLFAKQYENAGKLNKAIARKDWTEIQKWLEKCDISIQLADGASDLALIRREASRYGKRIAKNIRQVMEKIVIRRNRLDLKNDQDYAPEITTLSEVKPPVQEFFELTPEQDAFYDRVITDYFGPSGRFHGAIYRPQVYLKNQAGLDDYQNNIYTMMLRLLVMRFESSFGAFRQSLVNAMNMMTKAKAFIDRMGSYLYSRKAMERIMDFSDDADAMEEMLKVISELEATYQASGKRGSKERIEYKINDPDFDGALFKKHIDSDIKLLKNVIKEVDTLKLSSDDPKCASLIKSIQEVLSDTHANIPQEPTKRKVLLFTAYSDTLHHIQSIVEQAFPNRVLAIDGSNFSKENAVRIMSNFDASFEKKTDDYDILLATDKLSEGFNLNRAGVVINYDITWNPTRVIQRVGRINRIGKKVFENLYIFNFFPTVKGSAINQNREIAQNKMFAIHEILGEDARIFSVEEEPSAAALYTKLSAGLDDMDEMSFYAEIKQKYAKAKAYLEANHPEALERISRFPHMIKTAFEGNPHGTFMFRRQGPSFFSLVHERETAEVTEWPLEDAIKAIECQYGTTRIPFSESFWSHKDTNGKNVEGTYERLKRYKPQGAPQRGGTSDAVVAVSNLQKASPHISQTMRIFVDDLIEDIQSYRTIPQYTISEIARNPGKTKEDFDALIHLLEELRNLFGDNYLKRIKAQALHDDIVVTIEKQ